MNRTRKGGQRVRYSFGSRWHRKWIPLSVHTWDCGPNCFSLLGYSNYATSNELARLTQDGMPADKVLLLLNGAYGHGHKWQSIKKIPQIHDYLPVNEATMASVGGERGGHYFVLFNDHGVFWAIDAQKRTSYHLGSFLDIYSRSTGVAHELHIVTSPRLLRNYYKVTMKMVKTYV